jgi:hypothetical protein
MHENKRVQRSLYKLKLLHFRLRTNDAISFKCLEQEASQWRNIDRYPGNIDIILIRKRPSVSLLPSNNPPGKRVQELARAI